jgi:acetylornithine deacetylase/succinyl-diaminopimelate desuccinylase-like protein
MSAADSLKVTVYGRGGHGASPQNTIDPVVLAAMIIIRRRPGRRDPRQTVSEDFSKIPDSVGVPYTAPDPGQVAKRVIEGFTQRKLPDRAAWPARRRGPRST